MKGHFRTAPKYSLELTRINYSHILGKLGASPFFEKLFEILRKLVLILEAWQRQKRRGRAHRLRKEGFLEGLVSIGEGVFAGHIEGQFAPIDIFGRKVSFPLSCRVHCVYHLLRNLEGFGMNLFGRFARSDELSMRQGISFVAQILG